MLHTTNVIVLQRKKPHINSFKNIISLYQKNNGD